MTLQIRGPFFRSVMTGPYAVITQFSDYVLYQVSSCVLCFLNLCTCCFIKKKLNIVSYFLPI